MTNKIQYDKSASLMEFNSDSNIDAAIYFLKRLKDEMEIDEAFYNAKIKPGYDAHKKRYGPKVKAYNMLRQKMADFKGEEAEQIKALPESTEGDFAATAIKPVQKMKIENEFGKVHLKSSYEYEITSVFDLLWEVMVLLSDEEIEEVIKIDLKKLKEKTKFADLQGTKKVEKFSCRFVRKGEEDEK